MELFDYLLDTYGYNEPILVNEILFHNYSKPWLYKELNWLCDNEKIVRFDKGLYYIPKQTIIGKSLLNPRKVIEKRYIKSGGNTFGYYSGQFLMNQLGLSNQMPNVIEIYTNNESAKTREIKVKNQRVKLRKARVEVTSDNVVVLRFLELMNIMPLTFIDGEKKEKLRKYILENEIRRKDITKYAPFFPNKTMRTLVESEVVYSVTQ